MTPCDNGNAVENGEVEEILITIENGHELPAQIFRSDLHIPTFAESESVSTISRQDACVSTEDDDFEARENILHFKKYIYMIVEQDEVF